jgi:predicted outer membrane repeat protein
MDETRVDALARAVGAGSSRRVLLAGLRGGLLAMLSLARGGEDGVAKNKRKKKKCAKAGQPTSKKRKKCCKGLVKDETGVCAAACTPATCAGANLCVDGTCQPCDVCASGCFYDAVQPAIDAAIAGETIRVCPGIFTGNLSIDQDLTLIGAGDGNGAGNTILQGTGMNPAVFIDDLADSVTLQHLRITGNGTSSALGGGILVGGGTLEVIACTMTGNTAFSGGGIFHGGTLILTESVITDNLATEFGGGIYNDGTVTIDDASRVTGNNADLTDPDSRGGGIYNDGGTVTLSNTENVTGNSPDNCAPNGTVAMCID